MRELSSNDPIEKAQYEPFLSTGSESDSSRGDPLELAVTDSDDLTYNNDFFAPKIKDKSRYFPRASRNETREELIYGFLEI